MVSRRLLPLPKGGWEGLRKFCAIPFLTHPLPPLNKGGKRDAHNLITTFTLFIILLSAFLIRLTHLTDRSLWFDEAFSWRLIQFPFLEFLQRAAADVHPILYYLILWLWNAPLHILGIDVSLFWLRLLSVLLSFATVLGVYFSGKVLFNSRRVGIIGALLTSVSAFQVQYAWETRMYTLGTLILCFALVYMIKTAQQTETKKIWRDGIILGLLIGALFHVHYFALFSIVGIFIFIGGYLILRLVKKPLVTLRSANTWSLVSGMILSVLIFLPWLTTFLKQRAQVQQSYWIPPMNDWSIPNTMSRLLLGGVSDFSHQTAIICTVLVALLLIIPLLFGRKKGDWLLVSSFIIPFLGAWYLSRGTSIYQDRYFVFASIPLIILLARSISLLPKKFYISSVVALIIAGYGFYTVNQFWTSLHFQDHPGTVTAVQYLRQNANQNEPILVSSSFVYFSVLFHSSVPFFNKEGRPSGRASLIRAGQGEITPPRLYSETGELSHFSGGPILTKDDIVGPEIFQEKPDVIWAVDTTGFGGSKLSVSDEYKLESEKSFSELFGYQGDIVVRKYFKGNP
ncbi:MAG: glycosyltransferase family 39 protein [bacterium]|nr:glycosyltransferase family 39 protein [bacterium]